MEHRDVNINNTVEVSGMGCIIVAVVFLVLWVFVF